MSNQTPTVSSYLYKLTPFSSLSLTALNGTTEQDKNQTFNTNIPFGMAMVIRRIHTKWFPTTDSFAINGTALLISQLTEAVGTTKPNAGDPLALYTDIAISRKVSESAVGQILWWDPTFYRFEYLPPHPGVPTLAQQLNVVLSGNNVDAVHTDTSVWAFFIEIYYELVLVNQQLKDYLANRISLQRTT